MSKIERYVPLGESSLSSDAPGWNSKSNPLSLNRRSTDNHKSNDPNNPSKEEKQQQQQQQQQNSPLPSSSSSHDGPVCWKCKGSGQVVDKKSQKKRKNKNKHKQRDRKQIEEEHEQEEREESGGIIHKRQRTEDDPNNDDNNNNNSGSSNTITCGNKHKNKTSHHVSTSSSSSSTSPSQKPCTVCNGNGTLKQKRKEIESRHKPGMITRIRKCPNDWKPFGPIAHGITQMKEFMKTYNNDDDDCDNNVKSSKRKRYHPLKLLYDASTTEYTHENDRNSNGDDDDDDYTSNKEGVFIPKALSMNNDDLLTPYPWIPIHPGEQLCNLVGTWRILQRVGSHRWTTDDIVTAYIAKTELLKTKNTPNDINNNNSTKKEPLSYLDLGCGNASVLSMVSWSLMDKFDLTAFGIEARAEAIGFAKRSLSFNIGNENIGKKISLINGDFRALAESCNASIDETIQSNDNDNRTSANASVTATSATVTKAIHHSGMEEFQKVIKRKFDLVTGTPPYFRVDFSTEEETEVDKNTKKEMKESKDGIKISTKVVKAAVINQGGMPTSLQSAPARCEFRGGIESYCAAASSVLATNGIFVVCENWLNNERVYVGAKGAGLQVLKALPIKGTTRKKHNLFAIYVMRKIMMSTDSDQYSCCEVSDPISVRNGDGNWTSDYAEIMASMSIPCTGKIS